MDEHKFRLLYSRRENDRIVARVVAEKEGVIKAQIEPARDGKDQSEAFNALRRDVEISLDRILKDVPGASGGKVDGGSKTAASPSRSPSSPAALPSSSPERQIPRRPVAIEVQGAQSHQGLPVDAPPAYGKAVKEWRSDEHKKG